MRGEGVRGGKECRVVSRGHGVVGLLTDLECAVEVTTTYGKLILMQSVGFQKNVQIGTTLLHVFMLCGANMFYIRYYTSGANSHLLLLSCNEIT